MRKMLEASFAFITLIFVSSVGAAGAPLKVPAFSDYKIERKTSRSEEAIRTEYLVARADDGRVLRIEGRYGVTPSLAERFIKDTMAKIRSIYDPHRDPYFAIISTQTVCPAKFQPTYEKDLAEHHQAARFFANARLTYGACSEDMAKYQVQVDLLYCTDKKALFTVERFQPISKKSSDYESVGCP